MVNISSYWTTSNTNFEHIFIPTYVHMLFKKITHEALRTHEKQILKKMPKITQHTFKTKKSLPNKSSDGQNSRSPKRPNKYVDTSDELPHELHSLQKHSVTTRS